MLLGVVGCSWPTGGEGPIHPLGAKQYLEELVVFRESAFYSKRPEPSHLQQRLKKEQLSNSLTLRLFQVQSILLLNRVLLQDKAQRSYLAGQFKVTCPLVRRLG